MRYIDADQLIKKIYPMGIGDGMYVINAKAVKLAIDNAPTADVVPKSEVDNLKVLLEMKEKAYEGLKELYDTDTEALVKAREKTEVEVAREIFEELKQKRKELWCSGKYTMFECWCKAEDEVKKKYTEDKE
jgi:hypothetical protein